MLRLRVPLVLASRSPRRRALLRQLGLTFEVRPADTDEVWPDGTAPGRAVEQLAAEKAQAVSEPGALVLGADTVVVLDGDVLGKPASDAEAAATLRRLSGRTHTVYTGLALRFDARLRTCHAATRVTIAPLSDLEIDQYVATGSPRDKAGAYGIQDEMGAVLVSRIDGEYTNVVGLPLRTLYDALHADFPDLLA